MVNLNVQKVRQDFPILSKKNNGKKLIYLDSTATTQKPKRVIDSITAFYNSNNANIHRGVYSLSALATEMYEDARKEVASFINADFEEVIFTRGTTESINLLAYCLNTKKKKIVLSEMEHHSNIVPWQEKAKREGYEIEYIKIKDFKLAFDEKILHDAGILSITHVSNVLGTVNDVKKIISLAKKLNIITILDAAQSAPHMKIDVKELDADFVVFSGHKMLGPSGIGCLYGKKSLLEKMPPFNFGGDMIKEVTLKNSSWNELPYKFEAGTPNMEGAIGLCEAVKYLKSIGMDRVSSHERLLGDYCTEQLQKIPRVTVYRAKGSENCGIVSFNISGIHPHDVGSLLDDAGICIRAGHHCAMPLMKVIGVNGTNRASFYIYNTKEDVDILVEEIKKIVKIFNSRV